MAIGHPIRERWSRMSVGRQRAFDQCRHNPEQFALIPISYCLLGYFYRLIGHFIVNLGARKPFKKLEMQYCI